MNALVPDFYRFEDGARIDYLVRNDTLRYIDHRGIEVQLGLLPGSGAEPMRVEQPSDDELARLGVTRDAIVARVKTFIERKGKGRFEMP
jgi:hypothetical protein